MGVSYCNICIYPSFVLGDSSLLDVRIVIDLCLIVLTRMEVVCGPLELDYFENF